MKLYGSLSRLVSILFRKDSQDITVRPNQGTTYTAARDVQLPPGDTAHVLTSASSSQTLTNKTIDGDDNTLQDISISSLKTVLGDADEAIVRDASGAVVSAKIVNANIDAAAAIDATKIADGSVTNTEFQYIGGLTSDAQTQINSKVAKAGDTMTGDLLIDNAKELRLGELDTNGTAYVALKAPDDLSGGTYTLTLPPNDGASGQVLRTDGAGVLTWVNQQTIQAYVTDWVTADTATFAITHNLGTKDVQVEIYDKTDDSTILIDSIVRTSINVVTVSASEAPPAAGWRVTIHAT